jgi:hypothetical protein
MSGVSDNFSRNRYTILPGLLKGPEISLKYTYALKLARLGLMLEGDNQAPTTPCAYGDPIMDGLLTRLLPDIEQASGVRLFPTYSYFRVYKSGDTLKRHTDRPSCEISVSLCLGYEAPQPWPLWIESSAGATSVILEVGDAVLYRGIECPHWRAPFEGSRLAQVFLHYVDQQGPHVEWKFDKRSSLTSPRTPSSGSRAQTRSS